MPASLPIQLSPAQAQALLDFCSRLVQTNSPSGQEEAVAHLVQAEMVRLGFDDLRQDDYGNLAAVRQGSHPGPCLLMEAHMDVVPANSVQDWRFAPFSGTIAEGRLWGRGSADTKGSLASLLWAAAAFPAEKLHGTLVVVASVCEENLTGAALRPLIQAWKPEVLITGEPTGLRLGVAQKGRYSLFVQAHGRAAHTSTPQAGDNAIDKLLIAAGRLRNLPKQSDPELGPEILELIEICSEPYPNGACIPFGARGRWIGRSLPGMSSVMILQRLQAALADLPGVELTPVVLQQTCYTGQELHMTDLLPGWRNQPHNLWEARILNALDQAGLPAQRFFAPFGTNASAAAELGVPACFIYGPGQVERAHAIDECVEIDELYQAVTGYGEMIRACLQSLP